MQKTHIKHTVIGWEWVRREAALEVPIAYTVACGLYDPNNAAAVVSLIGNRPASSAAVEGLPWQ